MTKKHIAVNSDTLKILGWKQTGILMLLSDKEQEEYWAADRRRRELDAYAQNLALGVENGVPQSQDCEGQPCPEPRPAFDPRYARNSIPRGRGIA